MSNYINMVHTQKADNEKFCKECGTIINAKAEICPKCGVRQEMALLQGKNKLVAALLAFFLGCFGIQHFYLGNTMWGVIFLLFCWTGIPAIIGIIHCILLLISSDEEFARKYPSK